MAVYLLPHTHTVQRDHNISICLTDTHTHFVLFCFVYHTRFVNETVVCGQEVALQGLIMHMTFGAALTHFLFLTVWYLEIVYFYLCQAAHSVQPR